jgi:hypothetical protein
MMKKILFLGGYLVCVAAFAGSDEEYFWFMNEVTCGDAKVTVRSYCQESERDEALIHTNTMCTQQQLRIVRPGRQPVKRGLQALQGDENLLVKGLTCTSAGGTTYLYLGMDNGGNCDTCESDAILDLAGRWMRIGKRWSASKAEKNRISRSTKAWRKQEYVLLTNTVRDPNQEDD